MLLLHHDHHPPSRYALRRDKFGNWLAEPQLVAQRRAKVEASGRTRTDDYEFTKLVLWLLRHRGEMASAAGIAPATSTFARWRSDLTELRGQNGIRDRTCTDLASQALQVSGPSCDVRFANRSGPT